MGNRMRWEKRFRMSGVRVEMHTRVLNKRNCNKGMEQAHIIGGMRNRWTADKHVRACAGSRTYARIMGLYENMQTCIGISREILERRTKM